MKSVVVVVLSIHKNESKTNSKQQEQSTGVQLLRNTQHQQQQHILSRYWQWLSVMAQVRLQQVDPTLSRINGLQQVDPSLISAENTKFRFSENIETKTNTISLHLNFPSSSAQSLFPITDHHPDSHRLPSISDEPVPFCKDTTSTRTLQAIDCSSDFHRHPERHSVSTHSS